MVQLPAFICGPILAVKNTPTHRKINDWPLNLSSSFSKRHPFHAYTSIDNLRPQRVLITLIKWLPLKILGNELAITMQSYLQFGSWQSGVTPPLSSQYRHWLAETLNVGMKTIMSLLLVVLINYILTWTGFIFNCWRISLPKSPATVPYLFPIIGSSFNFVWNPLYFIRTAT